MDVAQLGVQVTSKGIDETTRELNTFTGAAGRAEAATDGLAAANKGAVGAASAAAQAYSREGAAASSASKQIELASRAANQNHAGLMRTHNTANLAAQGFDIVTTAAGGMSAGLIGMQQGLQVAQIAMTTTDGFAKTLAASFMAMLSPVTLLAVALTTLAAVGIQSVNWSKMATNALYALASVLQTIAPYAVGAAAALALLYAPAMIGGLVQLIALLGRVAVSAVALAGAFAAANPAAAFVIGLTAAVAAANVFRDELSKIFGVDIVGAAKDGVNLIIGSFVAAFEDVKFVWAQLPNIVGAAAVGAANAAIKGIESMLNAATGLLNSFIENVNSALSMVPGGLSIGTIGNVSFGQIDNPYADKLNAAVGDRNAAVQGALGRDYLGDFGKGISAGASEASAKLKELAGSFTAVEGAAGRAGKAAKDGASAAKDPWDGLRESVDETSTSLEDAKATTKGFLSDLRNGLMNGEGFFESFGKAALGVLDRIVDKIETDLVDALFSATSGTGAGGGIFGSLLGGLGSLLGFNANGTEHWRGGLSMVGERGPEIVNLPRGAQVVPNHRIGSMGGGQNVAVAVTVGWSKGSNGDIAPIIEDVSQQTVNKNAPKIVGAANRRVVPTMAQYQAQKAGGDYRVA